jgi:sortase A
MTFRRFVGNALGVVGLLAVGVWLASTVDRVVYQSWQEWAFERQQRTEPATIGAFVEEKKLRAVRWLVGGQQPSESVVPKAPPAPTPPPAQSSPIPANGIVGRLSIPRLGLRAIVRDGDEEDTLRVALGHIPSTAWPGQIGNVGIAGHRDTLFRSLRGVRKNDLILVDTQAGQYVYRVQSTRIVNPRDVSVLQASGSRQLTLVTCYPFNYVGSAPDRFIVQANQVSGAS